MTLCVTGVELIPVSVVEHDRRFLILYDDLVDDKFITLGHLYLTIENNTPEPIVIFTSTGTAIVGHEQVDTELWSNASLGGTVYPGASKSGDVLFGLRESRTDQITKIRYVLDAARSEDYDSLTDEQYDLDITW